MNLLSWLWLLVFIFSNVLCRPGIHEEGDSGTNARCNTANDAMDYLHASFTDQMSFDQKCRRYAVMASLLASRGPPQRMVVSQVSQSTDDEIDQIYQTLDYNDEVASLYMTVIDGYRAASNIGVPFLELFECLKRLDKAYIRAYVNHPELTLLVDMQKQVLRSPETIIDLDSVDRQLFSKAFRTSLEMIFRKNLKDAHSGPSDYAEASSSKTADAKLTQMATNHRHREQERLRKRRLLLLRPADERVKRQKRQQRQRDRKRERRLLKGAEQQINVLLKVEQLLQSYPDQIADQGNKSTDQSNNLAQSRSNSTPSHESEVKIKAPQQINDLTIVQRVKPRVASGGASCDALPEATLVQSQPRLAQQTIAEHAPSQPSQPKIKEQQLDPMLLSSRSAVPETYRHTSPHYPEIRRTNYNYLLDSNSTFVPSQFEIAILPRRDQFDDTDSVLQSFADMPHNSDENLNSPK